MSHQNAFCFITLNKQGINTLGSRVCDYQEAEKHAASLAVFKNEPVYIMRAAVKIVPPEPICTIVPLKAAFEVG